MDSGEDGKVVIFPTAIDGSACETCGSPRQAGVLCRSCACQLVDAALTGGSEEDASDSLEDAAWTDSPPRTTQLCYGHYQVCASASGEPWELGRGSMGITYKALDTHLGCLVALKIINARHLDGVGVRDRFLREARAAAQLRHSNVASVFHLGLDARDCFYAMEFIEGETLEDRVRREGALPCRLALGIAAQAARALRMAHAQHFIHRDIKPTNIMLARGEHGSDEEVAVKLIDFGLVKTITEETAKGGWCQGYFAGTPHYASPEQLNEGTVDVRSDIFSLGRCLEYMLLGGQPGPSVSGSEQGELPLRSLAAKLPLPSNLPDPVAALLVSMVAVDPSSRPQSADELLTRIAECLRKVDATGHRSFDASGRTTPLRQTNGTAPWKRFLWPAGLCGCAALCAMAIRPLVEHWNVSVPPVPSVSAQSRVLSAQGKEYFRKHTYADNQLAIKSYLQAITLSPSNAEAHAALASVYYENVARFGVPTEQLNLAVASAERAVAIDPNLPEAFQALGAIRNLQGQPWEALLQLHRALELNPKSAQAMCDFSLIWVCVGQPQLALPWAKAATRLEPSKVQGWHAAAEASVELCADEQAEQDYRRCLELRPIWMSGHCGLIHLHLLQGDFARARQDFEKAQSIQPDLLFPLTLDAQIALFSGEYAEAEKIYRHLLKLKRDGYVRYYGAISYLSALGFLRLQAGDLAEGNAFLAEAEGLHSANSEGPEDVYDLAAIRAIQGRQEDALPLLSQAISSGWNDYRTIRLDPRFGLLRDQPRFQQLVAELGRHVAAMRVRSEKLCEQPLKLADYPVNSTAWTDPK